MRTLDHSRSARGRPRSAGALPDGAVGGTAIDDAIRAAKSDALYAQRAVALAA